MHEIDVKDREDFERQVRQLRQQYGEHGALLFRGLCDATWALTTTLERQDNVEMPVADYYRVIAASEPQIRTFTTTTWDEIETYPEILRLACEYDAFHRYLWGGHLRALGYMAYLRHHGFPSPLMDWTRSPYIAAYFAFRPAVRPPQGKVAVFAFCERPSGIKEGGSDESQIFHLGPNVRTDRRHYLQQGEYTICLRSELDQQWRFVPHETVFDRNDATQDVLWKFNIPWTERIEVLKSLDDHNVNAFSLFESDEALLETIALRRLSLERFPRAV